MLLTAQELRMGNSIDETELVIFDTETTGLDVFSGDRMVEIAGIRIKGDKQLSIFESLVNPGRNISPGAFKVNGIKQEELNFSPSPRKVFPEFMNFVGQSCLCSYNAAFDVDFLNNELKLIGSEVISKSSVIDILKISRKILPGLNKYSLYSVAQNLKITYPQQHRALADVKMAVDVFLKLKEMAKVSGIKAFEEFLSLFQADSRV